MDPKIAPAEVFAALVAALRAEVSRHVFETWFRDLRRDSNEGSTYVFSVQNSFVRDWIEAYYRDLLVRLLVSLHGKGANFRLVVHDGPARTPEAVAVPANENGNGHAQRGEAPEVEPPSVTAVPELDAPAFHDDDTLPFAKSRQSVPAAPRSERRRRYEERFQLFSHPRYRNFRSDVILNEDYRFENFVVGPSNHLAHAAAVAVANAPGNAYNPLFLHGSVGLGKTHLLQGICASVLAKRPDARILYLSCETFVNQFISAVEAGELSDFRYRYRHVDMLLIDDIHFLARKERTQEEFFHTFNTLQLAQADRAVVRQPTP